jgi:trimethylamine--corrinoid protein Co-methyltransferase
MEEENMERILTEDEVSEIHSTALSLLENVGMAIYSSDALNLLKDAGVNVDFTKNIARPTASLVEEEIKKAPREFSLGGRNSKHDLPMKKGTTYFRTPTGCTHVLDFETGIYRESNLDDLTKFARLIDGLDQIDYSGCILFPQGIKPQIRDLYATEILLENTEKHVMTQIYTAKSLPYLHEMAKVIVPDDQERQKRPPISLTVSPTSPLQCTKDATELLMGCAKYRIPIQLTSIPIMGGTSPVTLAGTLMMQHAELLMGILITQLTEPGAPIIYSSRIHPLNMKTGTALCGAIENVMLNVAMVQIARRIGLPVDVYAMGTDSNVYDEQAAIEKTLNMSYSLFISEPNVITGVGELESLDTVCMEQLVIDDEIISLVRRMYRGIEITDETLAEDVIAKVGPGGHFLRERHTRNYFKKESFFPSILNQTRRRTWEIKGSKDVIALAKEKIRKILHEHEPVPLEKSAQEKFHHILKRAEKDLS